MASDGGIYDFGNAAFAGSTGGTVLDSPIVGMAPSKTGGYWMTTADGTVYGFGGTLAGLVQPHDLGGLPAAGMVATPDGGGYWLVDLGGFVHASGDATTYPLHP